MMKFTKHNPLVALIVSGIALTACAGASDPADSKGPSVDPTTAGGTISSPSDAESAPTSAADCTVDQVDGDLALYNWSGYLDPELKTKFEQQYDVKVTEEFYESNEAMQPIIQAGGSGYDVIVPADYMVSVMIAADNLMTFNKDAIPNLDNLSPAFASPPYDPNLAYSAAYQWGTSGLGVDLGVTGQDVPHSWGLIFDEDLRAAHQLDGKIVMLNDSRETLGAALLYLGYSVNTTSQEQLDEARDLIADNKDSILAFDSERYTELLFSGEAALAQGYSGKIISGIDGAENPGNYTYFIPEEGGTRWIDNMSIPFDAPHPCTAHTFINFILDPQNGAALSNFNRLASPNEASKPLLNEALLNDPRIYPPQDAKLEILKDTGEFEANFSDAFDAAKE